MKNNSRIFIAGHNNLVGSALVKRLKRDGFNNLLIPSSLDFTDQRAVYTFFEIEKPEYVFLLAGKTGGIVANSTYPAEFIYENLQIQNNIIHFAWKTGVEKLLFVGSSCTYPRDCPQPMKEEYLMSGPMEPTSEAFSIAKLAGLKMCQAYNQQYEVNFISVIPATIFGPEDNFDIESSHVIPAFIRKFHEAKVKNESDVTIWGSGEPLREFIYVDDVVEAYIFLMQNYNGSQIINIGTDSEISIRELAELVKKIVGFEGELKFDSSKPDGAPRKLLDSTRLISLGWRPNIDLQTGLENTYRWYVQKYVK